MNSLKLVYDNGNPKNSIRIYSYCGKKFRFYFPHMNGSSNMPSLSVMDSDGIWHVIETSETLNVKWKNLYYLERDSDFMACAVETWQMEDGMVVGSLSPVIFDIYSFEL